MDEKSRVFICLIDGQQFEKFAAHDEDSRKICTSYTIDGVRVEETEWARRQQNAIARDLASLFPQGLHPELSSDQCGAAHAIWDALILAPSHSATDAACHQLIAAPPPVQQAIIHEIAGTLRGNPQMQLKKNPFVK